MHIKYIKFDFKQKNSTKCLKNLFRCISTPVFYSARKALPIMLKKNAYQMSTKCNHKAVFVAICLAVLAPQVSASNHADTRLSDKAICEKLGQLAFNKNDESLYGRLYRELDNRRLHKYFTINPRACELYGLASAVNSKEKSEEQIQTAIEVSNVLNALFVYELKQLEQLPEAN